MEDEAMRRRSQVSNVQAQSQQSVSLMRARSAGTKERSQLGNRAMQQLLGSGALQAKLSVSQPGDKAEQEADRVAETVMRMPDKSSKTFGAPPKSAKHSAEVHRV